MKAESKPKLKIIEGKRPDPTPAPSKYFSLSIKCPKCGTGIAIQDNRHIYGKIRTDHKI